MANFGKGQEDLVALVSGESAMVRVCGERRRKIPVLVSVGYLNWQIT